MANKQDCLGDSIDLRFMKGKGRDRSEDSGPTPEEGVRLIKAFRGIKNADLRSAGIRFLEKLADTRDLQASLRLFID
jgi:hypothetical protein